MSGNNLIVNNNGRKRRITTPLIALLIAVVISIAFAGVFVYYPMTVTLQPVQPPVYFAVGTNSNKDDLGNSVSDTTYTSNTIYVSIISSGTSLDITVHPTYQVTYYKNVAIVYNNDPTKAYKVCFRVETSLNLPAGSEAYLYIYSQGDTRSLSGYPKPAPSGFLAQIYLTSTDKKCVPTTLGSKQSYEMDLYIYIPGGGNLETTYTANLLLIYTPQTSENPPGT